jgi:hypothetical protein
VQIMPFTHELLSQYVGTSREIITLYMNQFRRDGYLDYSRQGILLHGDALRAWPSGSKPPESSLQHGRPCMGVVCLRAAQYFTGGAHALPRSTRTEEFAGLYPTLNPRGHNAKPPQLAWNRHFREGVGRDADPSSSTCRSTPAPWPPRRTGSRPSWCSSTPRHVLGSSHTSRSTRPVYCAI